MIVLAKAKAQIERECPPEYSEWIRMVKQYVPRHKLTLQNKLTCAKYVTNAPKEASWVKMRSVTEQAALDEFLSTAELAGTDFTAEKLNNVQIIHTDQRNPYLLSATEERITKKKHAANTSRLTIPRRPQWDDSTTPQELDQKERESLLDWRRGLAELQETKDLLMTPFERNIEVWRQLWRVIERSDLVVQIVDARNPLLFRSADLEDYVKQVDAAKRNLLLVNKADMMTQAQRENWADYFDKNGINYRFFSASLAKVVLESLEETDSDVENSELDDESEDAEEEGTLADQTRKINLENQETESSNTPDSKHLEDIRTRILSVEELEELFLQNVEHDPATEDSDEPKKKTTIGLVGYPNVGKSSTINALIGAKKVSVSSTPGKTKHFQTIHLSPEIILCDCPGLVFPNFASTKAELVCNGVLPIDQLREFTGPAGLVAQRIPQAFLEAVYGIQIQTRPLEEGGTGTPTAEELLVAYAIARGFAKTGKGQPDESRAARYVLKDYVNGKLLFVHPPPNDPAIDPHKFNRELYSEDYLPEKRRAILALQNDAEIEGADDQSLMDDNQSFAAIPLQGPRSKGLDKKFFGPGQSGAGHLNMPFNYQYSEQGKKQLTGRKLKTVTALEKNIDPADMQMNSKKHFKGGRKKKMRSEEDAV